ncbi:MAG: DUF2306 domain-containing protein [Cypionkella sp.]
MRTKPLSIRASWPIAAALLALSCIPVAAGVARLVSLASGEAVTLTNARFFAHPLPVQLHIVGASLFCVLGALQFWPGFRRSFPRGHRWIGRIAAPADIVAGLSGLWMNQFYPYGPNDGLLLYFFRLFFGAGMVLSMVLGVAAILRRDIVQHEAWMMRAYAIGLGAGTQAVTQLPWILLVGLPEELPRALLMGAAWVLNLAVAEWLIRRQADRAYSLQDLT